ncbi:Small ubiquitin-related modifier 3 [Tupaia chinensis]|uniref:Small ubiquitin-related modifier 3 n=1 Tax=Tupaia chinensis TaxID=246437 RepID=L9JYY8_TUPCH|nr:Small ubiquitin-related modifier 3 [Tupaia chinensis]
MSEKKPKEGVKTENEHINLKWLTTMSEKKPKEGVKTENEHINLKVAGQDGSVVQFKIKRHTPLSKLMKACEREGLSMRQIRFRFDQQPMNETDTPAQLAMEDEGTTDVFQQQSMGDQLPAATQPLEGCPHPMSLSLHMLSRSEHVTIPIAKESTTA